MGYVGSLGGPDPVLCSAEEDVGLGWGAKDSMIGHHQQSAGQGIRAQDVP